MNQRNRVFILLGVIFLAAAIYYFATTDRTTDMILVGTVDANQVVVNSRISGRIEKLNVDEGTPVKQGDLIAVLDSGELTAQKQAAEATIRSLESKVAEASAAERSTAGETSSAVQNAQARLQSARSSLAEAEATLKQIAIDNTRIQPLVQQGVLSKQEGDRSEQSLKAQQARVAALKDQVSAAAADLEMAKARLHQAAAAQSTVSSARAEAANARAQLQEALTRLGYTTIEAPVSGTVSVRVARQGEVVSPGEPIVTIVDLSDTWIRAAIPETYADHIVLGQPLKVRLPSGAVIEGKVFFKSVEGEFATQRDVSNRKRDIRTVVLKVRVDNDHESLVPGMTAEVLVPKSLLQGPVPAGPQPVSGGSQ